MKPETLNILIKTYLPAITLDVICPSATRKLVREILSTAFFALIIVILSGKGDNLALGIFLIVFALATKLFLIEFFYNSYFFVGDTNISFPLASVLYRSLEADPVAIFILSPYGRWILSRGGIDRSATEAFLKSRSNKLALTDLPIEFGKNLADLAATLWDIDLALSKWLLESGVDKATLVAVARWCEKKESARAESVRWWSRERLARVPGIAKDWAYGKTPHLDIYSTDFILEARRQSLYSIAFGLAEITEIEAVLARSTQANAMVVGGKGAGTLDVLYGLARQIDFGTVYPELEHKRMVKFDANAFVAFAKDKGTFESELIIILNEAVRAGNIILIFDDFPGFVQNAQTIGSDLTALMSPYFSSNSLQIIGLAEPQAYHEVIETSAELNRFFEKVSLKETGRDVLIELLQAQVEQIETRHRLFFAYGAVEAMAKSAERYFSQGVALDKANDLLAELVPLMRQGGKIVGKRIVRAEDVLALVERKTGIPLGQVTAGEKDTLLNLEKILHQRIIGQDEAVKAISNAMRRSRSGVNNPNRPMGSFLFLGPTGVGKTETTKALAFSFFGNEEQILRLDMSEYNTADSLDRLIGSFTSGRQGVLANMLRDKQYGVLLLDEFEKTDKKVQDLFLQILDEGFFTDAGGKKVNTRNVIIIATSNAGSQMIWDALGSGTDLEGKKAAIIDSIVGQGIFKPELINRFDGTILFHPLSPEDLAKIARLMLGKLNKRLAEKGVSVAVTDGLVKYLVEKGRDQKFGARSMNRAIQENVEQAVADRILRGEAKPGTVLNIEPKDLL